MGRYIVCVFDGDRFVYDAARAVQQLDDECSIAVYEAAIISKDAGGEVQVEDAAEDMPFGTGTGMLLGGLLGLLMDADVAGVDDDFLDTITRKLEPGKFALIAEISEVWTVPLDQAGSPKAKSRSAAMPLGRASGWSVTFRTGCRVAVSVCSDGCSRQ